MISFFNMLPCDNYQLFAAKSDIHGIGTFATRNIKYGEEIIYDQLDNLYGRFWHGFNHSCEPNAIFAWHLVFDRWLEYQNDNSRRNSFFAIKNIKAGEEILVRYDHKGIYNCNCQVCRKSK